MQDILHTDTLEIRSKPFFFQRYAKGVPKLEHSTKRFTTKRFWLLREERPHVLENFQNSNLSSLVVDPREL
ncbi:MAG TPA: hypothetical protein VJB60_00530, partial [Candidatus Peribacterales bacterium]|nr:hypothetical protein [Candidatus Peribacterales bacterium]